MPEKLKNVKDGMIRGIFNSGKTYCGYSDLHVVFTILQHKCTCTMHMLRSNYLHKTPVNHI